MARTPESSARRPSLIRGIMSIVGEFRKTTWPTPAATVRLTIFVLALAAVLTVLFGLAVDNLFARLISFIGRA